MIFQTDRYRGESHFGGVLVTRLEDGATLLFQPGDDSAEFLEDVESDPYEGALNILCDQYWECFEVACAG